MKIGVPKELKHNEARVGINPAGVELLVKAGHCVYVQKEAGNLSGFTDKQYIAYGAIIIDNIEDIYNLSDLIVKVKEPHECEYDLLKRDQILFAFLHLDKNPKLTDVLLKKRITTISNENVICADGSKPLLIPMSEVAGAASVLIGANLLQKHLGGEGILLSSIAGILPAKVVIIGAGTVGMNALRVALGLGADVTVVDNDINKLRSINNHIPCGVKTVFASKYNIEKLLPSCDLLISAVLYDDASQKNKTFLVTEEMVKTMKKGSVIMDVSVDRCSIIETVDKETTHNEPTFIKHDVIHYSVTNIPGAYPRTSTIALTNVSIKYILEIANKGIVEAVKTYTELQSGVSTCYGKLTDEYLGDVLNLPYVELSSVIGF